MSTLPETPEVPPSNFDKAMSRMVNEIDRLEEATVTLLKVLHPVLQPSHSVKEPNDNEKSPTGIQYSPLVMSLYAQTERINQLANKLLQTSLHIDL